MSTKTESHEFIGWYEGFHGRDAEVERLTAERDWLKAALVEIQKMVRPLAKDGIPGAIDRIVIRALAEGTK